MSVRLRSSSLEPFREGNAALPDSMNPVERRRVSELVRKTDREKLVRADLIVPLARTSENQQSL